MLKVCLYFISLLSKMQNTFLELLIKRIWLISFFSLKRNVYLMMITFFLL